MAEDFEILPQHTQFWTKCEKCSGTFQKINCQTVECFCARNYFTSCGTEPTIGSSFCCADLKVKVITSKIEHHAVLYTVQALQKNLDSVDYVQSSQMEK
jgi:cysteine desulfurase